MIKVPQKFLDELNDIGITMQELLGLEGILTEEESEQVQKIGNTKKYVQAVMDTLNNRNKLPKRFEKHVKKYNGYSKQDIYSDFDLDIQY